VNRDEEVVEGRPGRRLRPSAHWHIVAVLLFTAAGLITFRDVLRAGPMSSVIIGSLDSLSPIAKGDAIFEAWLTARNAHTIATAPHRFFDTPHCAPTEKTLTLGVHMATMGLLALPVAVFTPNPALAYNFSTFMLLLLSAVAMYLLVKEWTGVPAAGIVAGLLYGFNPLRLGINITHPSTWDSAWLVFALFFSRRLFAHGRWRDAIGLAVACSLQIGASFYPLIAAALLAPAFAVWLVCQYRFQHLRVIQLAFVVVMIAVSAALLLGPYLNAREAGAIGDREFFFFVQPSQLLPGSGLFLGWGAITLAILGSFVPRRFWSSEAIGDPRWALGIGALMTMLIAAGPHNNFFLKLIWSEPPFQIPNFYAGLASIVPGLDSIRVVFRFSVALLVAVCIFAGLGAASLIQRAGSRSQLAMAGMIALAMLSIVLEPEPREAVEVRADPGAIRFFEDLAESGNRGPILELPLTDGHSHAFDPSRILLSAYHKRRTSACFGSYQPAGRKELAQLASLLPKARAVRRLRELGFTTVVLDKRWEADAEKFHRKVLLDPRKAIQPLRQDTQLAAYSLGDQRQQGRHAPDQAL